MIKFYIDNIADLKKDIDTYKTDVKTLADKKDKQIEELKADHNKALEEQQKGLHEQMKDKYGIEIAKKDLEFQKLNNEIEQLKVKKAEIYNFLKSNGLVYTDGEVKPIINNNNEMTVTKVIQKDKVSNNKLSENIIQKHNKDIDINRLKELINLIEPIKEIIQEYNKSKNIIEIERIDLKPPSVTEVIQSRY